MENLKWEKLRIVRNQQQLFVVFTLVYALDMLYGKEYPNRVTMGAMIDFKREASKDVNEIGVDMELLTMFMFCCVRSACRADEVVFDLNFQRFADGIELTEFNRFQQSMASQGDDGSKKKEMSKK